VGCKKQRRRGRLAFPVLPAQQPLQARARRAGMYADMDFEALRSLGRLLAGQQLLLAAMSADAGWDQAIPNAWMASAPRHPFWLFTLAQVIKAAGANLTAADRRAPPACTATVSVHGVHAPAAASERALTGKGEKQSWRKKHVAPASPCHARLCHHPASAESKQCRVARRWDWLEATTGPVMLHAAVAAFRAAGGRGLTVLEPGVIYPVDWRDTISGPRDGEGDAHSACNPLHARFNDTACKLRHPGAFAITYWTHSWGR